jgi:hypothetical protein
VSLCCAKQVAFIPPTTSPFVLTPVVPTMPEIVRPDPRAVDTAPVTAATAVSKSGTPSAPPGISATSVASAAAVVASGAADVSFTEANAPGRRQQVRAVGCYVVGDSDNHRVQVLMTLLGGAVRVLAAGDGVGPLRDLLGGVTVCVATGEVFVSDTWNDRIDFLEGKLFREKIACCAMIINSFLQLSAATVVHRGKAPTAFTAAAFLRYVFLSMILFKIKHLNCPWAVFCFRFGLVWFGLVWFGLL